MLSNYKPGLLKYDSSKSRWAETTDTKNIRYRLEFNEKLWKSTASTGNDLTRKLTRLKGEGTKIRVIAQQRSTDSSGEHWNDIADAEIVLDAVCDKHNWKCSNLYTERNQDREMYSLRKNKNSDNCS